MKFLILLLLSCLAGRVHAQLFISSGETVTVTGSDLLHVQEDLVNNVTLAHITLSGGSAQSISGTGSINNLTVNKNAGTATITSGRQTITHVLTMTAGTLAGGGRLTLKSDATTTARVAQVAAGASITGDVTVERYIPASRKWRMLTAPLTGSSNNSIFYNWQNNGTQAGSTGVEIWGPVGTLTPSTTGNGLQTGLNYSMRSYTPTWQNVTDTKSGRLFDATTNHAYTVFVTGPYKNGGSNILVSEPAVATTLSATGNLITGTHTKTLEASPAAGQYFLVGNPYASPVDPTQLSGANLANTFYMWDASAGVGVRNGLGIYVAFNRGPTPTYSVPGSTTGFSNAPLTQLQSGQAFFAKADQATTNTTIIFEEADKTSTTTGGMFGPQQIDGEIGMLRLTLQQNVTGVTENTDGAVAFFYPNGNPEVDRMDGSKLMNSSENVFFTRKGKNLTFEHRPTISSKDTLFVRVSNMQQATYRLAVEGSNLTVSSGNALLIDTYNKKETPLKLSGTEGYDFSVTPDSASIGDRFMVVFSKAAAPVVVAPDVPVSTKSLTLYPNPVRGKLQVAVNLSEVGLYSVQVYNAAGGEVWQRSGIASGTKTVEINTSGMVNGLYHLVLTDAKGATIVEKFVKE